jgi:hypothetical protein
VDNPKQQIRENMLYYLENKTFFDNAPNLIKLSNGTIITGVVRDINVLADAGYYTVRSDEPPQPQNSIENYSARVVNLDGPYVDIIRTWEPATPTIPENISARQIRLWLIENNISLASVEAAINQIPDEKLKEKTLVEWEYAPYIERSHPLLNTLGEILGLTSNQIDTAFLQASEL